LDELWTLLQFVSVTQRSSRSTELVPFSSFQRSGDKGDERQMAERLRSLMKLHTLRRLKSDLERTLPPKTRETVRLDLEPAQRQIYNSVYARTRGQWQRGELVDADLNNSLMQLRKVCIHPLLMRNQYTDERVRKLARLTGQDADELRAMSDWDLNELCNEAAEEAVRSLALVDVDDSDAVVALLTRDSVKFSTLRRLFAKLLQEGHRILLFSQMTRALDLVAALLDALQIEYVRLQGSTPVDERQQIMENFTNNASIGVFLLSTRAGGVGLNLVAADTVIFLDLDFNVQSDRQAEDRAHRIGQSKPVRVISLITNASCEERIAAMRDRKIDMIDRLMAEGRYQAPTAKEGEETGNKDDVRRLFGDLFTTDAEVAFDDVSLTRPTISMSPVKALTPPPSTKTTARKPDKVLEISSDDEKKENVVAVNLIDAAADTPELSFASAARIDEEALRPRPSSSIISNHTVPATPPSKPKARRVFIEAMFGGGDDDFVEVNERPQEEDAEGE